MEISSKAEWEIKDDAQIGAMLACGFIVKAADGQYDMTQKGARFCLDYFAQLEKEHHGEH